MRKMSIVSMVVGIVMMASMVSCDTVGSVSVTNPNAGQSETTYDTTTDNTYEPGYEIVAETSEVTTTHRVYADCSQPTDMVEVDGRVFHKANNGVEQDLIDPESGNICHFDNGYHPHSYSEACYPECPSWTGNWE